MCSPEKNVEWSGKAAAELTARLQPPSPEADPDVRQNAVQALERILPALSGTGLKPEAFTAGVKTVLAQLDDELLKSARARPRRWERSSRISLLAGFKTKGSSPWPGLWRDPTGR